MTTTAWHAEFCAEAFGEASAARAAVVADTDRAIIETMKVRYTIG